MKTSARSKKALVARRNQATLESARAAGLLGSAKSARIAARVSATLVAAAKRRSGVSSDTDLIEIALARLALDDDHGLRVIRGKSSSPGDFIIEF